MKKWTKDARIFLVFASAAVAMIAALVVSYFVASATGSNTNWQTSVAFFGTIGIIVVVTAMILKPWRD